VQQYNAVPPYRETHAYITRVIADCNRKKLAQPKLQAKPASHETSTDHQPSEGHATAGPETHPGTT